jgi:mannose-6-phosphate isomerase-like protein (cupin superfamily)
MSEHWQLLTGRAAITIAATEHLLTPGQAATAAEGVTHSARVLGDEPALVRMTLRPALRWLEVVERLFNDDDPAVVLHAYPDELAVA